MAAPPPQHDLTETEQPGILAANIITFCLAVTCVALRFCARRITKQPYWFDDWLILASLLFGIITFAIIMCWVFWLGLGLHTEALNLPYLTILKNNILALFIGEIFYTMTTALIKVSILAFYWRIFNIASIRLPIKLMGGVVTAWTIARVFAIIFHCWPVQAYWDKTIDGVCKVSDREFFLGTNTVNLIMDVVILSLPMPYIKQLQMKKSMKLVVAGIFALGGCVCIASIMYLVVSHELDMANPDITWTFSPIVLWAGAEMNLGIVSACLPSLRPIFLLVTRGSANAHGTWHKSQKSGTAGSKINSSFGPKKGLFSANKSGSKSHPFTNFDQESSNINLTRGEWGSSAKGDVAVISAGIPMDNVDLEQHTIGVKKEIRVEYT